MKGLFLRLLLCAFLAALLGCAGALPPVQSIDRFPVAATIVGQPSSLSLPAEPSAEPAAEAGRAAGTAAAIPENTPIVDATSPQFVPTPDRGKMISGRVLFGSAPVPGARVQLRSFDSNLGKWTPVLETRSDDKGDFILENPPVGDYSIGGLFPDETEIRYAGEAVTITPGKSIAGIRIVLTRDLTLLQPAPDALVTPPQTLKWSSFPNAAIYRVLVVDSGTTEPVFEQQTANTEVALPALLTPGRALTWTVTALAAGGETLSSGSSQFTLSGVATAAVPEESRENIPPACRAEGLKTKQYVNAADNYCYLYPARFEPREIEPGRMGVAGPALDKSAEPVYARLTVSAVEVRPGGDLNAIVDEALKEYAGMNVGPIARRTAEVGGEPAIIAEPVPGYLSSEAVFVQHDGRLYRLDFWPLQVSIAQADVDELFQLVTSSFSFLDATG